MKKKSMKVQVVELGLNDMAKIKGGAQLKQVTVTGKKKTVDFE
jgi:hypothetical protein